MKQGIYVSNANKFFYLYYAFNSPNNELDTLINRLQFDNIISAHKHKYTAYQIISLAEAQKQTLDIEPIFYTKRDRAHYEASDSKDKIEW